MNLLGKKEALAKKTEISNKHSYLYAIHKFNLNVDKKDRYCIFNKQTEFYDSLSIDNIKYVGKRGAGANTIRYDDHF